MSLSSTRLRSAILAAAVLLPLSAAHAQQAEPTVQDLLKRIEEQDQKILVLQRKLEIQDDAAKTAKETTPVVKASPKGFSLQSADGQNTIKLRGTLHFDGRFFASDDPSNPPLVDTWQVTRLRPILEGTVGGIYDFKFMPDFGQGKTIIQDAYVTARFLPQLQVTAGKFKAPFGLERLQSANDIRFVARAFPTSLAPNRDLGLQVGGSVLSDRLTYALSWTNGVNDGNSTDSFGDVDTNAGKEWTARVFALPFGNSDSFVLRGLGLGIAGSHGTFDGTTAQPLVPSYKTPAQSTFFSYRGGTATPVLANGTRERIGPQFYWYAGRFGLLGEYTHVSQDVVRTTVAAGRRTATFDTSAWQLQASWFLTGEEESFRGFKPNNVFSLDNHTWGAFELVARYHVLDPDDDAFLGGAASFADPNVAARKASAFGVGLNWYFNENLKWVLDYDQTSFDGGAPGGADRADEKVFLTRFALGF
jgi:phosphate-selective porin OprO/OprP